MTKVVNRFALACGAVFLILCGLFPKLAALVSIMPQSVLGGAAVIMFSSVVMSGIQLIGPVRPLTARGMTMVSVALGLGYGLGREQRGAGWSAAGGAAGVRRFRHCPGGVTLPSS